MRSILSYIGQYARQTDKLVFALSALFGAFAIFINYHYDLNKKIYSLNEPLQYLAWFGVFIAAFSFAYLLQALVFKNHIFKNKDFLLLLFLAPALFAWKMAFNFEFPFSTDEEVNTYWNHVVYWPFKLLVLTGSLFVIWRVFDSEQPFYGLTVKNFNPRPYVLMLLIMVPLIAAASTQPDFLTVYPKLKKIEGLHLVRNNGLLRMLYELSYGSDFISIELFFRGFLVLCFMKWVGKDAILPMALFYCTIHFGKPLGECISSFFGGILLGIVTYNTRSIFGGLIVHLGIAWVMELGGYIGRSHF